jgi:hypothetical protein
MRYCYYDLGSLPKPEEQELSDVVGDSSCDDALGIVMHPLVALVIIVCIPFDLALNLSLEVGWVARADQGHLDVLVRVRLQLPGHRLKLDVVPALYRLKII